MNRSDTHPEQEERTKVYRVRPMLRTALSVNAPDVPVEAVRRVPLVEAGARLGNYQLLFLVARGGMAEVWLAWQHRTRGLGKLVALKMILPELATQATFERMFAEEARLAALIRHRNVCEVFEFIELQGLLALSMEWVDGDTLAQLLREGGPLEPRLAARIIADAAAGLHAAHEARGAADAPLNLVHRDVSPQNILISRDGQIKLSDFGIAKALNSLRETTEVGQVKGKSSYMSPEQAQGCALDRRSDVFSLGVVLYLVTVGKRPFRADGARAAPWPRHQSRMDFERPHRVNPDFPRALESIIERALQWDPAERYQTAAALRLDLESWLASSGPSLTEADVARALVERRGTALDERDWFIREALTNLPRAPLDSDPGGGHLRAWSTDVVAPPPNRTRWAVNGPACSGSQRAPGSCLRWCGVPVRWLVLVTALLVSLISRAKFHPEHTAQPAPSAQLVTAAPAAASARSVAEPDLPVQPLPPLEPDSPVRASVSGTSSSRASKPSPVRARAGTAINVKKPQSATKRVGPTEREL